MPADAPLVDMTTVTRVLDEAMSIAEDLHATPLPAELDSFMKNNSQTAVITRDLLRLAELCRLAAAEVYSRYWEFKGFEDPR